MKIKVVSGFVGHCDWKELFEKSLKEYCNKWGYEFEFAYVPNIESEDLYKHPKGIWWRKLNVIKQNLKDCDYLLWVDADCVILNRWKPLDSLINSEFDIMLVLEETIETGAMLFKNSEWTHSFIEFWDSYRDEVIDGDMTEYKNNNHEALTRILQQVKDVAQHFHFAKNTDFVVKHVHVDSRTDETLLMHVAGSTNEDKIVYMEKYLQC